MRHFSRYQPNSPSTQVGTKGKAFGICWRAKTIWIFLVNSKTKTWTLLLLVQSVKWSPESFLRARVTSWSPRTLYNSSRTHDFDTHCLLKETQNWKQHKESHYTECTSGSGQHNRPSRHRSRLHTCLFWHWGTKEQKTRLAACCIIFLCTYIFVLFDLWYFHGTKIFCLIWLFSENISQMWYVMPFLVQYLICKLIAEQFTFLHCHKLCNKLILMGFYCSLWWHDGEFS